MVLLNNSDQILSKLNTLNSLMSSLMPYIILAYYSFCLVNHVIIVV